jgi:hypothetical protein
MANVIELRDLKGPSQSEFDYLPLNIHPHVVLGSPEHGAKRMAGTLGLTLEPGRMARFQADLVIPQWLANRSMACWKHFPVRLSGDKPPSVALVAPGL